jgi:hypothetical protein
MCGRRTSLRAPSLLSLATATATKIAVLLYLIIVSAIGIQYVVVDCRMCFRIKWIRK